MYSSTQQSTARKTELEIEVRKAKHTSLIAARLGDYAKLAQVTEQLVHLNSLLCEAHRPPLAGHRHSGVRDSSKFPS